MAIRGQRRGLARSEGVLRRSNSRTTPEHVDVEKRVRAKTVRAVNGHARTFACRVEPLHLVGVVAQHLTVDSGGNATHCVVSGGIHGHGLGVRLHAKIGPCELGDVRQLSVDVFTLKVSEVEEHVVLVGATASSLAHLIRHRARHHVARCEVLDGRCVHLHEAVAVGVTQHATLAAGGLGQEDAKACEACRVELEELHVLERQSSTQGDCHAVTGERVSVRRRLEDLACAAGGENHRLGTKHVDLAGRELI